MKKLPAPLTYLAIEISKGFLFALVLTIVAVYRINAAGLTALDLVLVGTAHELTIFVLEIPTGVIADMVSRRTSVILGYLVTGLAFILEGTFPIFWVILGANMLWALGTTLVSGADIAWITDEVGEEKVRVLYVRGSQFQMIGGVLGIVTSVVLGKVSLGLPLVVAGALFLALGLVLLSGMPETGFQPLSPAEQADRGTTFGGVLTGGVKAFRARPDLAFIFGITALLGMAIEGYDRLWEFHLITNIRFPLIGALDTVTWFGIITASGLALGAVANEAVGRGLTSGTHHGSLRSLLLLNGLLVLGLATFALATSFGVALGGYLTIAVLRALIAPVYLSWINRGLSPRTRATVNSIGNQFDAMGQIVGGPILGVVAKLYSVRAALLGSAVTQASAALLFLRAARARQVDAPPVEIPGVEE